MKLLNLLENIIILEGIIEDFETRNIGDGEGQIPKELYNKIKNITNNNFTYTSWLTKKIISGQFKEIDDLTVFEEYFEIFEKFKSKYFTKKDINQYKNGREFVDECEKFKDENPNLLNTDFIKDQGLKNLKKVGIILMGEVDGYQIFEIPNHLVNDEEAWKVYKNTLGKCINQSEDNPVSICTVGSFSHWKTYLARGPLFVAYKYSDPLSPYQISFEDKQFKDKNDKEYF